MSLETLGPDCDVADIAAAMERDGACIVRDVLSAETLACPPSVAKDLDPDLADLVGYTMGNFALGFCTSPELGDAGPSSKRARVRSRSWAASVCEFLTTRSPQECF